MKPELTLVQSASPPPPANVSAPAQGEMPFAVVEEVSGIAKRAQEFEENPDLVRGIIAEGCERARTVARDTLDAVRQAMAMNYR